MVECEHYSHYYEACLLGDKLSNLSKENKRLRDTLESIVENTPHETHDDEFCARCEAELAILSEMKWGNE